MALMRGKVFVAGAMGAIGRRLVPQLVEAGHVVFGTTRSVWRAREVEKLGATAVVVNVFDREELLRVMREVRPGVVIHQLTDLPKELSGPPPVEVIKANARVREEGTRNLAEGAVASGARRFIAQSIAWVYASGKQPYSEDDPLDRDAAEPISIGVAGVLALEQATLNSPPLEGVVLRYGQLYGPGTWNRQAKGPVPVHVDAAAHAAFLAIATKEIGIFNIAEETGFVSSERARRVLRWDPGFRLGG